MNAPKKPNANAVLKNLSKKRQESIWQYRFGEKRHTLAQTVAWLKKKKVKSSCAALSDWAEYWRQVRQWDLNEQTVMTSLEKMVERGTLAPEKTQEAGQMFFCELAMNQHDNPGFVRIMNAGTRERAVKVSERKVKLLEEREAKAKADASKPKLTPEEKQARYREILGMEE
ncbi:MAG: hypothetical protein ABSA83_07215 [Verrucomicrobiota bacterium]|jgi:hypothetical protein